MDFRNLSLKPNEHKFEEFSDISSIMSLSYMSKFDFQNSKSKNMAENDAKRGTNFIQSVEIMNFVPSFHTDNSQRVCAFSKTLSPVNNIKKFESYSQFSTMNILSYLVGGFVGSKSQVGFTSMQGDRFQIWDLVWQKLIEIMGSADTNCAITCDDSVCKQSDTDHFEKKPVKQTYADVTKMKIQSNSAHKKGVMKENFTRFNKHKKRLVAVDVRRKGKLDFGRCEKKSSLQEMDGFSSSRWSNSKRKHCKKGIEKMNRRDEREAARDGLEFVSQELDRSCSKNYNNKNMSVSCRGDCNRPIRTRRERQPGRASDDSNQQLPDENVNVKTSPMGHGNKDGTDDVFSAIINRSSNNNSNSFINVDKSKYRHSISSVDSEDSFIVFDKGDSNDDEEIMALTKFCYGGFLSQSDDESSIESLSSDLNEELDNSETVAYFCPMSKSRTYFIDHSDYQLKCLMPNNNFSRYDGVIDRIPAQHHSKIKCDLGLSKTKKESQLKFVNNACYSKRWDVLSYENLFANDGIKCSVEEISTRLLKSRSLSECSIESEDSFITFGSADELDEDPCSGIAATACDHGNDFKGLHLATATAAAHLEHSDSDSDEDYDQLTCPFLLPYAADHNYDTKSWLEEVNSHWTEALDSVAQSRKESDLKKVHFPPDGKLATVRKMLTWNFALRAARVGPWEELARDTMRFQNRICCVGEILENVLSSEHRQKVWQERFSNQ